MSQIRNTRVLAGWKQRKHVFHDDMLSDELIPFHPLSQNIHFKSVMIMLMPFILMIILPVDEELAEAWRVTIEARCVSSRSSRSVVFGPHNNDMQLIWLDPLCDRS